MYGVVSWAYGYFGELSQGYETFCLYFEQCSGSGSVGSVSFWTSRIQIHLSEVRIWIFNHQAKIVSKTLISTLFVTFFMTFLSLKNDVNVPSKEITQKTFVAVLKVH
jgi:hypothetical protein